MSKTVVIQNTFTMLATLPIEDQKKFTTKIGYTPETFIDKKTKSGIVYFVEKNK